MQIRAERPGDEPGIRTVNEGAFDTPAEANLVDALRAQADPFVSLVAEHDGVIVGHIAFSPVSATACPEARFGGLAPMAVRPADQRRGIGSALVRAGLDACRSAGWQAVVVLGHPEYYPRFGFVPASRFGIRCEYDAPGDAFMALELERGALQAAAGLVRYHPAFASL